MPCYRETGACFGCGKQGHMIRDCPENKKLIVGGSKDDNVGIDRSLKCKEECLL